MIALLLALLVVCSDAPGSGPEAPRAPIDGDGHLVDEDCDDANNAVFPGADERCNGVDDDRDRSVDEGFDLDGFLTDLDPGCAALGAPACDDQDQAVNPGALEVCYGSDDDCDGDCDDGGACSPCQVQAWGGQAHLFCDLA